MCSMNMVFLKLLQNLLENTCAKISFLIKFQVGVPQKRDSSIGVFFRETYFVEYLQTAVSLKAHPEVWDNFCQLKILLNDEKLFILS